MVSGPIYSNHIPNASRNSIRSSNGRQLWKTCLTDVIELQQNHRQQDAEWAAALENFRINKPTQENVDLVSSRYMFDNATTIKSPPKFTMTAVPFNDMREKAIRYCERRLMEKLPEITDARDWRTNGVLLIKARIQPLKTTTVISDQQKETIRNLGSKKLGRPGNLYCVVDAPYIVTDNSDVAKGVANGTLAYLQDIVLKPSATLTLELLPTGKKVASVCASEVDCLLFKHKNTAWTNVSPFSNLQKGCFPVIPTMKSVECKFNASFQLKIKVFQFACVLSLVLTGHKMQGISTDAIILGSLAPKDKSGNTGWLYVILSRVRTIHGLFLMEQIEKNHTKYVMRSDVQREMTRLRKIQLETIKRLDAARTSKESQ